VTIEEVEEVLLGLKITRLYEKGTSINKIAKSLKLSKKQVEQAIFSSQILDAYYRQRQGISDIITKFKLSRKLVESTITELIHHKL